MLKHFFVAGLMVTLTLGAAQAEPGPLIPWAQPETFDNSGVDNSEVPLFEKAIEDERRRRQGLPVLPKSVDLGVPKSNPEFRTEPTAPEFNTDAATTKSNNGVAPFQPIETETEFKTLEVGSQGPQVKAAQRALLSLGFALPAGADGDYGGQTVTAIKAFQSSAELPLSGKLDKATFDSLTERTPPEGKKVWEDKTTASKAVPEVPLVKDKKARVLIDLSEHRLCVYDASGSVQRVFPVASGAADTPTDVGIKVVTEKLADPTALAEKLWPESKGTAFGNRLIDLNWYNPDTGGQVVSDEELHGTLVLGSIGRNTSHGCVRLTNDSIEWLYHNLSVGDVVVIRE